MLEIKAAPAMQKINHGITALRRHSVTGREIDDDFAVETQGRAPKVDIDTIDVAGRNGIRRWRIRGRRSKCSCGRCRASWS